MEATQCSPSDESSRATTLRPQEARRIPQDSPDGPAAAPAASTAGQMREATGDLWTSEGLQGICQNQLTPAVVRRAAEAFAGELLIRAGTDRPRIVLADDGRPLTAELLAAAGEGLRWSGCDVYEIGTACLPVAAATLCQLEASGALVLGNATGEARTVSVSFLGSHALPWSLSGRLDRVRQRFERGAARPSRKAGRSERRAAVDPLAQGLLQETRCPVSADGGEIHLVLDTACEGVAGWLVEVLARLGIGGRVGLPEAMPLGVEKSRLGPDGGRARPLNAAARGVAPAAAAPPFRARREAMVARSVLTRAADFGFWMDGNARCCTLIDQRGRTVSPKMLLELLACSPLDETDRPLLWAAEATGEELYTLADREPNSVCGNAAGQIWFGPKPDPTSTPHCDARWVILRLLTLLATSRQPLRKLLRARQRLHKPSQAD